MTLKKTNFRFHAQALSGEAFTRFGDVIEHRGNQRRWYLNSIFEHTAVAQDQQAWVVSTDEQTQFPLKVEFLEKHMHTAQAFVPLLDTRFFIFVAASGEDGSPNLDDAHAFISSPGQGVSYKPGTWHFKACPMTPNAQFLVMMHLTGNPEHPDEQFFHFDSHLQVICHV